MGKKRDHVPGVADKLRAARAAAGLSQIQAGEASGVHQVQIAKYETDKATPTIAVLLRLAEAYGIDARELLPAPAEEPRRKKGGG